MNTVLTIFVVIASISLVLSSSIPQYGEDDDGSFLGVLDSYKTATKRQALTRNYYNDYAYYYKRNCKRWNDWCDPWSSNPTRSCCPNERLACKCNFFGSNCRCTRKLWGR
ncbi:uncharacterized protein LOC135487422 isoform X1 [Lineus longissimus]|uniref:uncharacterized protein LOC135487422 isoform X1 n=1 Tax=Lineus longissimus TaxID=88925 RepID=UPI002B4F6C2D